MKLFAFIFSLLWKHDDNPTLFSSAFSDGIKDMFTEMGYRFTDKKEDTPVGKNK